MFEMLHCFPFQKLLQTDKKLGLLLIPDFIFIGALTLEIQFSSFWDTTLQAEASILTSSPSFPLFYCESFREEL